MTSLKCRFGKSSRSHFSPPFWLRNSSEFLPPRENYAIGLRIQRDGGGGTSEGPRNHPIGHGRGNRPGAYRHCDQGD